MIELDEDRVVITGAGGGIGTSLCASFAGAGARVVGCDVQGARFDPVCVETHEFDLLDKQQVGRAADAILAGGVPSVVVLNAGWTNVATLAAMNGQDLDDELLGNFTASAHLCLALLPAMRMQDRPCNFVFISSVNAVAHFGNAAYSAAKAASMAWMRAMAAEEGKNGIRANAVIPASTRTHAWDQRLKADPGILDRLSREYPLGRIVTPQEVANAALFLASPLASGITGTSITVDAGLTASNLSFLDAISSVDG
jgi:NAD(P)-dependent dehydrogenase (short-subunit alcohol dehydrogenase family)